MLSDWTNGKINKHSNCKKSFIGIATKVWNNDYMNLIQTHRNDIEITRESSTTDQSQMKISLTATQ